MLRSSRVSRIIPRRARGQRKHRLPLTSLQMLILRFDNRHIIRWCKKEKVRQCLGFCTADFRSWLVHESAVQKPKHCLICSFLPITQNDLRTGWRSSSWASSASSSCARCRACSPTSTRPCTWSTHSPAVPRGSGPSRPWSSS